MDIRIATRRSVLALWQAEHVAKLIRELVDITSVTLVPMSTQGDQELDRSLQKIGGKGLFIKELEVAMQEGRADIAVHSMKDMPVDLPDGFCIAAVLPRGNVATRLERMDSGDYQAIVLASAGLQRLGLQSRISEEFAPQQMLPAAAQGVIGIECDEDRDELREILATLEHAETKMTTMAERAVALTLGANCQSPVASFATIVVGTLTIDALVASTDGRRIIRDQATGPASDAERIGTQVAERLIEQGANDILHEAQS